MLFGIVLHLQVRLHLGKVLRMTRKHLSFGEKFKFADFKTDEVRIAILRCMTGLRLVFLFLFLLALAVELRFALRRVGPIFHLIA